MRRISTATTLLAFILAGGAGPGDGATAHAQSPLSPAPPPETAPPLPHASSDASGAWVGDVLYVHAGDRPPATRGAASTGSAALYALSPADPSWATVWTGGPVRGAVLVSDGDDLYRVGGVEVAGSRRIRPDLERWDPTGRRWVGLTPMPSGRTDHAAVVVGCELWVIGGWAPSAGAEAPGRRRRPPPVPAADWRGDVLVADLDADPVAWTVVETASLRMHSLAAAVHGDAIWVAGGMTPRGPGLEAHRLDPRTRTLAPAPAPPVRGRGRGVGLGLASAGGSLFASELNQLYRLDPDGSAWQALAYEIEPERANHALVGGPGVHAPGGGPGAHAPAGGPGVHAPAGGPGVHTPTGGPGVLHVVGGAAHGRTHALVDRVETASLRPSDVADAPRRTEGAAGDRPALTGARRWPGFRGPAFGHSQARDLPLSWSDEEGVAWRHAIGGYGQSSPVVWDGVVFVTAIDGPRRETQIVEAVDAETGALRWRHTLASSQPVAVTNLMAKGAPTPRVDAERVYYLFESGDLGALGHDGGPVWSRSLKAEYGAIEGYGLGSSLAGSDETLFVLVAHDGPSYLLAVDPATGETRWKADRPARSSWTTPLVLPRGSGELVVVSIDGMVEAYDAETGERVWWLDGLSGNRLPSPVIAGERIVVPSMDSGSNLALPIAHRGRVRNEQVLWRGQSATASMSSPVVTGESVWFTNSRGVIRSLELESGRSRWAVRLPSPAWATPIVNGDLVYLFGTDGAASVFAADAAEPIEVARNTLTVSERVYGVAAVDGAFLVRTGRELIRIGLGATGE